MSTVAEDPIIDLEAGRRRRQKRRRRRKKPSVAGSSETTTDGSICFSDSDADQSWHSPLNSTAGGSFDECRFSEIEGASDPLQSSHREEEDSSVSDYLSDDFDLESGELEMKVHSAKELRDCRICHLDVVEDSDDQEIRAMIELGCSCKGDLAAAHKQCAETWFKIRGNTTCEICGTTALNIAGEHANDGDAAAASANAGQADPAALSETRHFWHGRRLMNTLLACMVLAFVISWLFHFNVLS